MKIKCERDQIIERMMRKKGWRDVSGDNKITRDEYGLGENRSKEKENKRNNAHYYFYIRRNEDSRSINRIEHERRREKCRVILHDPICFCLMKMEEKRIREREGWIPFRCQDDLHKIMNERLLCVRALLLLATQGVEIEWRSSKDRNYNTISEEGKI